MISVIVTHVRTVGVVDNVVASRGKRMGFRLLHAVEPCLRGEAGGVVSGGVGVRVGSVLMGVGGVGVVGIGVGDDGWGKVIHSGFVIRGFTPTPTPPLPLNSPPTILPSTIVLPFALLPTIEQVTPPQKMRLPQINPPVVVDALSVFGGL